ncbi:unnamed protein product [Auanema sp. JU1783]|nr:unnamed protein product [Auanema sp. JU1783]
MNESALILVDSNLNFTTTDVAEVDPTRATLKLCLAIAYIVLFLLGTIGNGIVIVMIINVLTSMRRTTSLGKRKSLSNTNHVFIYVLGLSIVDFLVIMHLPFLVVDLLKGQWLFGTAMCKLYWFGESVNKLLSSFIMTVLSWDRYLAVCSPVKSIRIRSNTIAVIVLLTCSLLAVVLLLPVLIEATVFKIDKLKMIPLMEDSEDLRLSDLHGTTMNKCMFDSDATFTLYTFMIGFFIPALFITFFYCRVIYKLHKSSRNMREMRSSNQETSKRDTDRVKQVTKRIVAVIMFYFLCWTPQWALNIMIQFNLIHVSWMTPAMSALFFIAHLLVCFNSAANPVLYALINRELRQQHYRAMQKKRLSNQRVNSAASFNIVTLQDGKRLSFWESVRLRLIGIKDTLLRATGVRSRSPSNCSQMSVDVTFQEKPKYLVPPCSSSVPSTSSNLLENQEDDYL